MVKRLLDVVISSLGLIVLSPLLIATAVLIKRADGGRAFYRGARVGQHGKPFRMFKFRTMAANAEEVGGSSTANDDPRITRIGSVLRKYKVDELPQLINVLQGEMSLVGPRPQVQWAVDLYTQEERELLLVWPGITGYASLVFRDEGAILRGSADPDKEYLEKIGPTKIRLELVYVQTRSLWNDMKILAATAGLVFGVNPTWCLPEEARALLRETGRTRHLPQGEPCGTAADAR